MMRRALIAIISLLLAISFCGCSGDRATGQHPSDESTLTIMGKTTDLKKSYMSTIFDLYESQTGNEFEVIAVPDEDFNERVLEAYRSENPPDILMHFNNSLINRIGEDNFVYLDDQPWVSDLTPSAYAYCLGSNGNLLGLPFWENSVSGTYYNKTILKSLGLNPATTQAEFDRLCQALKSIGYTPLYWGDESCSWMYQFGLDPIFADNPELLEQLNSGEIAYADIPDVASMIHWLKNAHDNGWFDQEKLGGTWDGMSEALASGDAVMVDIWDTWFDTDFVPGEYDVSDFALMPIFMGTDSNGTYEGGNLNMMMVSRDTDDVEKALAFLDFCATEENYNQAFDGVATVKSFNGQTTNRESEMVREAGSSIETNARVSTAEPKIVGYNATEVAEIFQRLFNGEIDERECIDLLDESRIRNST